MTTPLNSAECVNCGAEIDTSGDTSAHRAPCNKCGSNKRVHNLSIIEKLVLRDGFGVKAKRPGEKRPYVEDKAMPSYSHRLGKHVLHERLIDRDNDHYRETVKNYEPGEIIHHCEEPLSQHINHGSAKSKATSPRFEKRGDGRM